MRPKARRGREHAAGIMQFRENHAAPADHRRRASLARGLAAAAAGLDAPTTRHFVLDVAGGGRAPQNIDLADGATQMNLFVGVGDHRLRLRFVDDKGADLLPAHEIPVRVVAQEPGCARRAPLHVTPHAMGSVALRPRATAPAGPAGCAGCG